MDFFQAQERARRQSGLLVLYFVLAVVGIVVAIYVPLAVAAGAEGDGGRAWWANYELLGLCIFGVGVLVGVGSLWKSVQLGGGGGQVALDLGGRQLPPDSHDFHERRLLNVVEEMALAAGMPVPDVYLLDGERGINAFAAGRTAGDAVIGVTRGCLETLTREELQGVIAHEFSHIQNGDMRLNLRLIGILHGIILLTLVGRVLMRSGAVRSGNRNGGGGAIVIFGLWLLLVGWIGVFFGRLIKAAVSRQREYLADASAVQFTRNPGGIGGALKRIGAAVRGSRVDNPKAEEASHMFFANGMASWLSTHPPLDLRIRAIEPSWDGSFPEAGELRWSGGGAGMREGEGEDEEEEDEGELGIGIGSGMDVGMGMGMGAGGEGVLLDSMTGVGAAHLALAARMHRHLPEGMLELAHGASGSQALVLALLMGQAREGWVAELKDLRGVLAEEVIELIPGCHEKLAGLGSQEKLGVVDLCLPALRRLGLDTYEQFLWAMKKLIARDGVVDLFEFTLEQVVQRHLDVAYRKVPPPLPRIGKLGAALDAGAELLWALALVGAASEEAAKEAYLEGVRVLLEIEPGLEVPKAGEVEAGVSLERVSGALEVWGQAVPLLKRQLLLACGRVVMRDGVIEDEEAELLRAIADAIGTPIPPLVVGPPPLGGGGVAAVAVVSS